MEMLEVFQWWFGLSMKLTFNTNKDQEWKFLGSPKVASHRHECYCLRNVKIYVGNF